MAIPSGDSEALEQELVRKTNEARALGQVAAKINSTLNLEEIFDIVLTTMDELFGFDHSIILLADDAGEILTVVASRGYSDSGVGAQVAIGVGVIGLVAKKRRMMRVSNLGRQRAYAAAIRKQMEQAGRNEELGQVVKVPGLENVESQIAIPLLIGNTLIGVFAVESLEHEPFDEGDEILVSIVANQAASALNNARLYDHLERLNETLEDRVRERTQELQHALVDLKDAQANVVQSAKMASLGSLVAGISHELNTPIGAIHSTQDTLGRAIVKLSKRLTDRDLLDRKLVRTLHSMEDSCSLIRSGTERVNSIMKRLKSFARLDEAELQDADIHECLNDTLALLQHEWNQRIHLVTDYGNVALIRCRPSLINQVFLNILMNAVEAIEGEGEIVVTTRQLGAEAQVEIKDSGLGIDPADFSKLFDPGYTTKGVGVGTGLGLSICYQIMKDHNGRIEVESELGKGASFRVVLLTNPDITIQSDK